MHIESLIEGLPQQRWFGSKHKRITGVSLLDEVVADDASPKLMLTIAEVTFDDESKELYHLPLLVEEDGSIRDAFEDIERLRKLGDLMAHGASLHGRVGTFHFSGAGLDPLSPPTGGAIR